MITPKLEEMILNGDAVYQTFVGGGAGLTTLPVGQNSYIVITDIKTYHFSNFGIAPSQSILNQFATYQFSINSTLSTNHFICRNDVTAVNVMGMPEYIVKGESNFNTYLIHKSDVRISFLNQPPAPWTGAAAPTPQALSQDPPPIGYGSTQKGVVNTVQTVLMGAIAGSAQFLPLTSVFSSPTVSIAFNGIQYPSNSTTQWLNVYGFLADNNDKRAFPIINIGYVKILKPIPDTIFSTS